MSTLVPRLTGQPLLRLLPFDDATRRALVQQCDATPAERTRIGQTIADARNEGWVSLWGADLTCLRLLRLHPAEVWGEEYWTCDGPLPELTADEIRELEAA